MALEGSYMGNIPEVLIATARGRSPWAVAISTEGIPRMPSKHVRLETGTFPPRTMTFQPTANAHAPPRDRLNLLRER